MNIDVIKKYKVVPVVVFNSVFEVESTLRTMEEGGLPIAEITYRTACAKDAILVAIEKFPNMLIGAGTVINGKQCQEAISLGVKFIVGPGFSDEVCDICNQNNVPYFPGCVTPSEIMKAVAKGCEIIKFFPSNVYGGIKAMKTLSAPFPQIKFIPTGGVDENNLKEYLLWDKIHAVGGSWMMKGDIKANCKKIREIVEKI